MPDDSDSTPDSPDSGTAPAPTPPGAPPGALAGGAVGATGGAAGGLPPQGAPGAQRNIPLGAQVNGFRRIQIATKIIETTLPMFGSQSKEGKVVIAVLNQLSREFGGDGTRGADPMDAVMRRQIMANRATPPQGPPGAGPPPGMPPGMAPPGGAPPGGVGPLPTPNRGPLPQPQVA